MKLTFLAAQKKSLEELSRRTAEMREERKQAILKCGYLLKKSDVLKKWNLRYFVLSRECLCYYQNEEESRTGVPKGLIFFNDMSVYIDELPDKRSKYCLKIVKKSLSPQRASRTYLFSCFSERERDGWLAEILYATAEALVMDPTSWIGRRDSTPTENLDFEVSRPLARNVCHSFTAKEMLQRCRLKLATLSLGRTSLSHAPSCTSVFDFNANRVLGVNTY